MLLSRRIPALLAVALAVVTVALLVTERATRAAVSRQPPPPSARLPVPAALPAPRPGQLSFASERFLVPPHGGEALLTVRRSGGSDGPVSFDWWTADLGAKAGRDFRAGGRRTVTLADGQDSARIAVPILGNPARHHTEMFAVRIASPAGGAALGDIAQATVFILPPDR